MNELDNNVADDLLVEDDAQKKLSQAAPEIFKRNEEHGDFEFLLKLREYDLLMAKATGVGNRKLHTRFISQISEVVQKPVDAAEAANEIISLLYEIQPKTALEGMLAVQMVGIHYLATEMMNRAALSQQTINGVDRNITRVTKLTRTFVSQLETLQKIRGKGQQTVRVEHVTVNAGGQALVGNVEHKVERGEGLDGK